MAKRIPNPEAGEYEPEEQSEIAIRLNEAFLTDFRQEKLTEVATHIYDSLLTMGCRLLPAEKAPLLTDEEIGNNLDLEIEAEYPCSDGSVTHTISVDKLLQAQRDAADKYYRAPAPPLSDKEIKG